MIDNERKIVSFVRASTHIKPATVNPDRDGKVGGISNPGRTYDVEIETVFREGVADVVSSISYAVVRVMNGIATTCP